MYEHFETGLALHQPQFGKPFTTEITQKYSKMFCQITYHNKLPREDTYSIFYLLHKSQSPKMCCRVNERLTFLVSSNTDYLNIDSLLFFCF